MSGFAQGGADLELVGVSKQFPGFTAVDNVSFTVPAGSFFALLGPSGCGKTTTLRLISGLEEPTSGQILVGGKDVSSTKAHQRPINTVFQSYALFPHMTVLDNVAFGLKQRGVKDAIQLAHEALLLVELDHLADRKPTQLSGGQQQRVALARAVVNRPALLLLDEPLGALDLKLRRQMQIELKSIQSEVGLTFLHVTHDQEEAMTMASRIAIMSKGRVLQVGTPEEIYEHPRNKFVADFIGNVNLFSGSLTVDEPDRCAVTTALGEMHVGHGVSGTLNMPVTLAVRPEKIEVSKTRPDANINVFTGQVKEIAYFGSYNTYIVKASDGTKVKITEANTSRHELSDITWEDTVFFWWSDSAAIVLRD